jgi:magnesium transporter
MMTRTKRHRKRRPRISPRTAPGASPGTLAIDPAAPAPAINLMAYDAEKVVETRIENPNDIKSYLGQWPVIWVNVDGLGSAETIETLGAIFNLHRLSLEDVVSMNQRPKIEEFETYTFVVARMAHLEESFHAEQLSLFLGANFVLTFQEQRGDCFEPLRRRIRENRNSLLSTDYLAYAILDALVDDLFPILEQLGERLDDLEEEISKRQDADLVSRIHHTRHDLLALRRTIWPIRDVLNAMIRDPIPLISDKTRTYLRDCYDHTVRIIDIVETYRDVTTGLMEFYQSMVSNRMNEIMKVLTVIATIFIPLTFVAGLYGMNFNTAVSPLNMPELNWYWGYPMTLVVMAAIVIGMSVYFRRKGWMGA